MDPRYGGQGHQGGGGYGGEASSYYNDQSNPQQPYGGGPGGGYGGGPGGGYGGGPGGGYGGPPASGYGGGPGGGYGGPGGPGGERYPSPHNAGPDGPDGERGLMGGLAGAAAGAYGGHKMGHGVIGAIGGAIAGHKLQDFVNDRKEKKEEEKMQQQMYSSPPPPYGNSGPHHPPPSHHHHHHVGGHHSPSRDRSIGGFDGNFSASSHDIHLEGDFDLVAVCRRDDGGSQTSTLNLNQVLSNEDGRFRWVSGGGGGSSVTVQQGDTLREIARRVGCNFEELARRNNINNPDMIYPGQHLEVPGRGPAGNFSSSGRDIRLVDGGRALEAELRNVRGEWRRARIELDERIGNRGGRLCLV